MGLTFQQKFYYAPDEVYEVYLIHDTSAEYGTLVHGLIEIPKEQRDAFRLEEILNRNGYFWQRINFYDLIMNGYTILDKIGVEEYENFYV